VSGVSKYFTLCARVDIEKHIREVVRISNVLRFSVKVDINFTCVVGLSPIKYVLPVKVTHLIHE